MPYSHPVNEATSLLCPLPSVLNQSSVSHYLIVNIFIEPNVTQQPSGAVPAGRMTGEISGATASTHDSGDPTGEGSTLKRKHPAPDHERCM